MHRRAPNRIHKAIGGFYIPQQAPKQPHSLAILHFENVIHLRFRVRNSVRIRVNAGCMVSRCTKVPQLVSASSIAVRKAIGGFCNAQQAPNRPQVRAALRFNNVYFLTQGSCWLHGAPVSASLCPSRDQMQQLLYNTPLLCFALVVFS